MPKKKVIIVNTNIGKNTQFVEKLKEFLDLMKVDTKIINGWENKNPLELKPTHIILSAVPPSSNFSLSEPENQKLVKKHFSWLKKAKCPVLGICYGHQIISFIFGGKVSKLKKMRYKENYKLSIPYNETIFKDIKSISVNVTHHNYTSKMPKGFKLITQKHKVPYIIYNPKKKMYGFQFHPYYQDFITVELLRRFLELK
ncbi:MAG: gamma-glutamyl-gamma-aminobutyrate hydrolase family protein [Nanoarchaeota archaeon]|nr:gamma-glutamyl-gamma-aminobutyrate hydrolase family protein [Nanoarchaeota archaeon]MCG2717914.1 gamma-glutamyl-gamma-aminobutyrate hydrolase family protein [Nanoarchaeota archaeon]